MWTEKPAVKGPGLRNDLEIRRTFLCPQCGRSVLRLGDVVSQTCACTDPPTWMLIQPEVKKRVFKFDKIEIPLTDEDLIVRERPRRMPEPAPEGFQENDRRPPQRPKRPKPERRSFESFQEDLAAKVQAETDGVVEEVIETVKTIEVVTTEPNPANAQVPDAATAPQAAPPTVADEFGQGL